MEQWKNETKNLGKFTAIISQKNVLKMIIIYLKVAFTISVRTFFVHKK